MLKLNSFNTVHAVHHNHELGICIASLQPKSYDDVIYKLKELSSLTKFDFIEGINDREIMSKLIKDYPCYTLGSLIRDPEGDIYQQFEDSCILAKDLNIKYLMFGGYQVRIKNKIDYSKFFELAKKYNRHLLLEPLKGTFPGTLEEVVKLQEQYGEKDLHLCLKNTEINHDDFCKYIDRVKNCHISFELYLKYYKELENLTRFTLEI
jgi:hypothetical protein